MATHKVFVYGTLKRGLFNHRLLLDSNNGFSRFIGEAKLEKPHYLIVTPPPYGFPALLRFPLDSDSNQVFQPPKDVFGELIEVDDQMLSTLDRLEKSPTWYYREESNCIITSSETEEYTDKSVIKCFVYYQTKYDIKDYSHACVSTFVQDEECVKEWIQLSLDI